MEIGSITNSYQTLEAKKVIAKVMEVLLAFCRTLRANPVFSIIQVKEKKV